MARPTPEETDSFLAALAHLLASRPAAMFQRVGGEVALIIVGHTPEAWTVRLGSAGTIEVVPGEAARPVVKVGLKPSALRWMLEGSLDVERAFEQKRLAVEGDLQAFSRFAQCFQPGGSLVGVRSSRS